MAKMTRQEAFDKLALDFTPEIGRLVESNPPESFFLENGMEVYVFNVYWAKWPDEKSKITMGPEIIWEDDGRPLNFKIKGYNESDYTCWAS